MNAEKNVPSPTIFTKPIFLLFGIGALLAYNAFLTELPFFNAFLSELSPGKTIPFLNFALNITFQFLILWKKDLFNLKIQLIAGLICSILFLILIPIVVIYLGENTIINMVITSILILIMGFINALLTSGFYSLASFFPLENIVSLNSGMAIAGILMNVIQYIVLIFVENDIILCALIFFSISGLILLICLIILLLQFKTDYYKYYLRTLNKGINNMGSNSELLDVQNLKSESVPEKEAETEKITEEEKETETEKENDEIIDTPKKELTFREMFNLLKDIDFLGMYIYIVTASLYPNAVISQQLYEIEEKYNINTILIIINTCDTIGRYLVVKVKPTKKLTYIVILSRTILIFTILLSYYLQLQHLSSGFTGTFLLINIIILAISNGVGTSLCFGIAPTLVDDEYKGQAGASVSFFATLGTFTGTILAFGTSAIMELMK